MYIVLGGAGYIGSHAVRALLDRGEKVVVVDNLRTGFEEAIDKRAVFEKVDLLNYAELLEVFRKYKFKAVFHFSASSLVGESVRNPILYFENNVVGAINLVKCMVETGVNKLVFSSTAAVYGEPEYVPIVEDMKKDPTSPYGESKLQIENILKWVSRAHDFRYVALRYFNVAGAHESGEIGEAHDPETHLIPIILQVAQGKRENITIFGNDYDTKDGTNIRDYIHVEDLIDAHLLAMEYLEKGGESNYFNLGYGQGFSNLEILSSARKVTEHEILMVFGERRAGDPNILIAANRKVVDVLGWRPKKDRVETIIEDAWRWHSSHPNGYKKEEL